MEEKIRIGISRCLLGDKVRYDGGHKWDRFLTDTLGQYVEYVPVCPEVECGLGIPRETLRLVGDADAPRLVTSRTNIDHTERMQSWAGERLKDRGVVVARDYKFMCSSLGQEMIEAVPGVRQVTVADRDGHTELAVILEDESRLTDVLDHVTRRGSSLLSLEKREPTLEDVFVDLVGRGLDVDTRHGDDGGGGPG